MLFDATLLNTHHYNVGIKDKVEQSWIRSNALSYTSVVANEKRAFGLPLTMVSNFYLLILYTTLHDIMFCCVHFYIPVWTLLFFYKDGFDIK